VRSPSQTPYWLGGASLGGWYVVRTGVLVSARDPLLRGEQIRSDDV